MNRLREILDQYGRWSEIIIYLDRIETHQESDFSFALENGKSLLESIGKEICRHQGIEIELNSSLNAILKKAFIALGYPNHDFVNKISSALATIGQEIGNLRNDIGMTSHGKPLEEIKKRNENVSLLSREFLIDSIGIIAAFLIRNFENEYPRVKPDSERNVLEYKDYEEFNNYLDDTYGEVELGNYTFSASEILFYLDKNAYIEEYNMFVENRNSE